MVFASRCMPLAMVMVFDWITCNHASVSVWGWIKMKDNAHRSLLGEVTDLGIHSLQMFLLWVQNKFTMYWPC